MTFRLKLCRILPLVKGTFLLPQDESLLQRSEAAVRAVLEKEKGEYCKRLMSEVYCRMERGGDCKLSLSQAARDMSKAPCGVRRNEGNEKKIREEDELWNEKRSEEEEKKRRKSVQEEKPMAMVRGEREREKRGRMNDSRVNR